MKSLVICTSIHHQNTSRIASAIAEVLQAQINKPNEVHNEDLSSYDIIGFGSGIYRWKVHKALLDFADNLPNMQQKSVFIFSTSGAPDGSKYHKELKDRLTKKNCKIVGEFNCRGWDTFGPLKIIGGLNKNKPNKDDIEKAKRFAQSLKI